MMRKIAVVVNNDNQDVSIFETINAIQNAGFKNVFVQKIRLYWSFLTLKKYKLYMPTEQELLLLLRKKSKILN